MIVASSGKKRSGSYVIIAKRNHMQVELHTPRGTKIERASSWSNACQLVEREFQEKYDEINGVSI